MRKKIHLTVLQFMLNKTGDITATILNKNLNLASARIQLAPALKAANELDMSTQVLSLHGSIPYELERLKTSHICLVGKMSANSKELAKKMSKTNMAAIKQLKHFGSKIAILYSDNMLEAPDEIRDFYLDLFKIADFAIYPSKSLFEISKKNLNEKCKAILIEDPWQLTNIHQNATTEPQPDM